MPRMLLLTGIRRTLLSHYRHLRTMASIIDGTALAKYVTISYFGNASIDSQYRTIREDVALQIKSFQTKFPRFQPQLCIVQAGDRPDSTAYVRTKASVAKQVGIKFRHIRVPVETSAEQIVRIVQDLNSDESLSGILVQLPLGDHITSAGERLVTEAVSPQKDVDG